MVRIRLARGGMKRNPFYYIVVTDSRNSRDGSFMERVGFFNPLGLNVSKRVFIKLDRIQYWINQGANPSNRVCELIKKSKRLLST
ncbi:30S ribosomal protein S16 [Candidatus Blochmanniella vafra str. BVAF]|uniref:Small ribosomal subunit protein bS16 n=1 Tax=Blochmanniella vafra (strain BVAF) TaxID=859654 RepID=E8Q5T2_BLOVB|nr:30S ribosomal protein S16 [Candidatus Blochmannia vafer]ADV33579.1 30S ribosomal protein S16 [Candidatus Blochmannia vafer str. BVAF]